MISRITGILDRLAGGEALIELPAGLCYDVLVPACDVEALAARVGQTVTLHTIHYLEGDPARGNLLPRLVGFASDADREFFRVFTTVKGIGIRKALRALARPVPEIAAAIATKDVKTLKALPEIGPRMAERIATELAGKVEAYAGEQVAEPRPAAANELSESAAEAVAILVQLGERRSDAAALVERALAVAPELANAEDIIKAVYRLRGGNR